MKAKTYLEQIQKYDILVENKIEEKKWYLKALEHEKSEEAVCRYVDLGKEIDAAIDYYVDKKKEVIEMIEKLDCTYYNILHKMYVGVMQEEKRKYYYLDEIATLYGKTYSWAASTHGRALAELQKIIGEEE